MVLNIKELKPPAKPGLNSRDCKQAGFVSTGMLAAVAMLPLRHHKSVFQESNLSLCMRLGF